MEANHVHQTIAGQVDHMKPAHLTPGVDVGIEIVDPTTIRVIVVPRMASFEIRLEPNDTYTVTRTTLGVNGQVHEPLIGIYCDQLGEILFGDDAAPWTMPMVQISTDGGQSWDVIA